MRRRILLVAAELDLRARFARELQSSGYAVELASDMKRALRLAAEHHFRIAVVAPGPSLASLAMILKLRGAVPEMIVVAEGPDEIARLRLALPGVDEFFLRSANEGALNRVGGVALSRSQCGDPLHRAQNLCRDDHRRSWPLLPWWENIGALERGRWKQIGTLRVSTPVTA